MPGLFGYQKVGVEWLTTKRFALLADEMGLGKSAQAVAACDRLDAQRILVICPAVARFNWEREFAKFSDRKRSCSVVLSRSKTLPASGVMICSYNFCETWPATTCNESWDVVILDEAHYVKNRNAKRTRAVFERIVPRARRVMALSGTPAPNHAAELYPLLHAAGVFRDDYWKFVRRYCLVRETVYGTQIVGTQRIDELRALLAPILLRRRKADVMTDLPPLLYQDVLVPASPVDIPRWYKSVDAGGRTTASLQAELADQQQSVDTLLPWSTPGTDGDFFNSLAAIEKRVAPYRRYVGLQKAPAVIELVKDELANHAYDKIVLFCIHQNVIEMLREGLREYNPLTIYGATPPIKRDLHIRQFQTQARFRVMLANIQAAGTAIDLTAACQCGFVEASWVPAENAQAAMRLHRITQKRPVTVRFFGLAGSSDEHVQRVLQRKTRELTAIFDAADNPFAD